MSGVERRIGTHLLREEPGLIFIKLAGELTEKDARDFIAEMRDISRRGSSLVLLVDLAALVDFGPGARSAAARANIGLPYQVIACFGAGFVQRVMVTLALKAVALLDKQFTAAVAFFDTEAEARGWLEEQRRQR